MRPWVLRNSESWGERQKEGDPFLRTDCFCNVTLEDAGSVSEFFLGVLPLAPAPLPPCPQPVSLRLFFYSGLPSVSISTPLSEGPYQNINQITTLLLKTSQRLLDAQNKNQSPTLHLSLQGLLDVARACLVASFVMVLSWNLSRPAGVSTLWTH